jgi:hypothetical protein
MVKWSGIFGNSAILVGILGAAFRSRDHVSTVDLGIRVDGWVTIVFSVVGKLDRVVTVILD